MEPRIQYANTEDGVSIAYYAIGRGPALVVFAPMGHSHLQLEWQYEPLREWYERLAATRTVVRWDFRGMGLSSRQVTDFSEAASVGDILAVVSRLGLESFAILTMGSGTPQAVAYAVSHPEHVTRLVVAQPWIKMIEPAPRDVAEQDWQLFTEGVALRAFGWSRSAEARNWAKFMRESINRDTWRRMAEQVLGRDVTESLPGVGAPTLVLSHPRSAAFAICDPSDFASRIPDSRVVFLSGEPNLWENEEAFRAIDEFFGEGEEVEAKSDLPSGTAIIVFADIVDSTGLTERLGDSAFRDGARELDSALRGVIREAGGTPVEGKLLGDGVLAVFTSARQAIEAALGCGEAGDDSGLPLHLGVHAGDVIREEDNVYGGAVNIAARIAAASAPGEVLVSQTVRDLARTSAGVTPVTVRRANAPR